MASPRSHRQRQSRVLTTGHLSLAATPSAHSLCHDQSHVEKGWGVESRGHLEPMNIGTSGYSTCAGISTHRHHCLQRKKPGAHRAT